MIDHAMIAEAPRKAKSCVEGRRRMNRVSLSDRKKTRRSGKYLSRIAWIFIASLVLTRSLSLLPLP